MASSNFPSYPFRLEERTATWAQNAWNAGNNSLIHSELWIIKNSASGRWANGGSSAEQYINGTRVGRNGDFSYNFSNSDSLLVLAQDNWFANDNNGYLNFSIDGYANVVQLGYTEVHASSSTPRIPRPPTAPSVESYSNITTSNIRVLLTDVDNKGASVNSWDFQVAENAAMTVNPSVRNNSGRLHDISGLKAGQPYYFRGRAANSTGWGAWGPVSGPVSTLAALYVSDGSAWRPAQVLVSTGTAWATPTVRYSNGAAWQTPISL